MHTPSTNSVPVRSALKAALFRWCIGSLALLLIWGLAPSLPIVQQAYAQGATVRRVCMLANSEVDMNLAFNANSLAKLQNPTYFGATGSAAPETMQFISLTNVSQANLVANNCDIYVGGGHLVLTPAAAQDIHAWLAGGNRYLIGACDYPQNAICSELRSNFAIPNGGVQVSGALAYNPLSCGGALSVNTFGGASTHFAVQPGDQVMMSHLPNGESAASTDAINGGTFTFTADADMIANSGSGAIGAGPVASSAQAKLLVNLFKLALDEIAGRTVLQCVPDYNNPPGTLSGKAYFDANANGGFDAGVDSELPAVLVRIYGDPGTPNQPADDLLLASLPTDASGNFSMDVSQDDIYRIEIDPNDPNANGYTLRSTNPLTGVAVTTGATTGGLDFRFTRAPDHSDAPVSGTVNFGAASATAAYGLAEQVPSSDLFMGTVATDSGPSSPTAAADGDDLDTSDDEDLTIPNASAGDTNWAVTVPVTNDTGADAYLCGNVDAGASGGFNG
ncbi:MAG: hypothetical protein AAF253_10650, partial [Pseudomonadota bacterium]